MVLYKYMPKQYLDAFFKRGSLKIGTLHEYRKVETYGDAIGDDTEGIRVSAFTVPNGATVDMGSDSPEAKFLRSMPEFQGLGAGVTIKFEPGADIHFEQNSIDAYIYCVSHQFDAQVMAEFGGSCIEITKPEQFFKEISRVIRHKANFVYCGNIEYTNRFAPWQHPHKMHPSFMKDHRYAYQNETRAIWEAKKATVQPLFIDVPRAIKFCRPFDTNTK